MADPMAPMLPGIVTPKMSERPKINRKSARTVAYETAGPKQLAQQPAKAVPRPFSPNEEWQILKQHAESRLNQMRAWRFSWIQHWQLLETYLLPRRGIFINTAQPTPNTMIRGLPINQAIIDPCATYAMRRCSAGMMSGLMSPSRPWFKLKEALKPRKESDAEAQQWFEDVEDLMEDIMARSNFYDSGAQMFEDLVAFGTGPMIIYEDDMDVIRCYNPCCGEYFLASSSALRVESLYRQFVFTIAQIVEMFGLENCPRDVQQMWQQKGPALETEKIVCHAIEPNFPIQPSETHPAVGVIPGDFSWREIYWVQGSSDEYPLSMRGFVDQPHIVPRWAVTSNDPYGRSVGMDVLPDIMQLQVESIRKAEAIEKMVRPPLLASMELKNEPSSILPGKVTYVSQLGPEKGMRPIYTVNPDVQHLSNDIKEVQQRIREGFFNDLFMMLETASNKNMTAYEVAQRQQEKLQVLGPVIERLQNEALGPAIKRVFRILERKGRLPPLPESLQGNKLGIEYVGMLSIAQRAAATAGLERFAGTMGSMQASDPNVADVWDKDEWAMEYAENLFLPKRIIRDPKIVAKIRADRAKQMQMQQDAAGAMAAVQGAKTLSEIDVGGGQNAISAMMGAPPSGPSAA